jgi:cell wall-associated NlpC family hydrolase
MHQATFPRARACVLLIVALLTACSIAPERPAPLPDATLAVALRAAHDALGTPYRYGGEDSRGFDCSGLVQWSYAQAGLHLSRTTEEQLAGTTAIEIGAIVPGDLLFFRLQGRKVTHVGIYVGDGAFIHAPATGRRVEFARLDDPFWQDRVARAGRVEAR